MWNRVASLRARSVERRDLLGHFDITIRDLPAHVISSQFERDLAIRDTHVWMVINRFEIRDQAVDEAEGLNEVLKLERSRQFVVCEFPPCQSRHDGPEFSGGQDFWLLHRNR